MRRNKARAAQLITEKMTLREVRRARKLTQVRMAKPLGMGRRGVYMNFTSYGLYVILYE